MNNQKATPSAGANAGGHREEGRSCAFNFDSTMYEPLDGPNITQPQNEVSEEVRANPFLQEALKLASQGPRVFPCRERTTSYFDQKKGKTAYLRAKSPYTQHGFQDATTDEAQIIAWWMQWPEAMIGFVPSGNVFVIDVDVKGDANGLETLKRWEAELGPLPATATVVTPSGGLHLYFRTSDGKAGPYYNDNAGLGIDLRGGSRGYVIAPPSILHDLNQSLYYAWQDGITNVVTIPQLWLDKLRSLDEVPPSLNVGSIDLYDTALSEEEQRILEMVEAKPSYQDILTNSNYRHGDGRLKHQADFAAAKEVLKQTQQFQSAYRIIMNTKVMVEKCVSHEDSHMRKRMAKKTMGKAAFEVVTLLEGAAMAARILETDNEKKEARANEEAELAEQARKDHEVGGCPEHLLYPGGLLGQMMDVIEVNTKYNHRLYALASALTFLSVVCLMNVCTDEGVHPNLYTIIVGRSGIGKDSSLKKPAKLFRMAPMENVTSLPNMVGANSVASGPAVYGHLEDHPKSLFIMDEFGETVKEVKSPGSAKGSLLAVLLESYSMPGEPIKRIYKNNARDGINIPWQAFSLLGAATPSSLWGALDKEDGAKGVLSRILFFELNEPKKKSRKKVPAEFWVPEGLLDELILISKLGRILPESINGLPLDNTRLEPKIIANSHEAFQLWDALETKYIDLENETNDEVVRSIYSRVPLHVSKLALLHAVSTHGSKIHSHNGVIGADSMQWAIDLVEYLTAATVQRLKESLHQGTYDKLMKTVLAAIDRMGRKEGRKGVLLSKVFNNVARNTPPHLRGQVEKQLAADGLVVEIPNKAKTGPRSSRYIITAEGLSLIGKA